MFEYKRTDFLLFICFGSYGMIIVVFTAAEKGKLKRMPFTIKIYNYAYED